jgi:dihydrofolate reductase
LRISLIVAAARNGVIGRAGKLPWHLPADLRRFKQLTTGKPVLMGRKTYDSIGKPLPGRTNIVITRDPAYAPPGVTVAHSFDAAIATARDVAKRTGADEIAVVGGADIFRLAFPIAGRIHLTEVRADVAGDTVFPAFERSEWREVSREDHAAESADGFAYSFVVLDRRAR